jgi:UDP-N-acetylmuramoyl-tripeptide--D-alanyl-D-alanine ligase
MEISKLYQIWKSSAGVCTDSRKIVKHGLFFALSGTHFDGNLFAEQALETGASYAIVDRVKYRGSMSSSIILVDDVLTTLQQLARYHRDQLHIPVLGITGSNGKTTTKELARDVMAKKYKVFATQGNLNNHIGVPLTLLSVTDDITFLIVEMGANHQGEIELLSQIANPDYGMITNIGKAHLEGFGGVEGIKKGKSELYRHINGKKGKIFINEEDEVLSTLIPQESILVKYAPSKLVSIVNEEPYLTLSYKGSTFETFLYGKYNINNIAFAMMLGAYFGVSDDDIINAIATYKPDNNRSQLSQYGNNTVIMDAFNANPSSMAASLETFGRIPGEKVVILGDMLELGEYSKTEHQKIIDMVESMKLSDAIFIGKHFYASGTGRFGKYFADTTEAKIYFDNQKYENTHILLKGSRGIAVEKILQP